MDHPDTVERLLEQHGTTYAADAGITLRDEPSPLWQLLVLTLLLSARISADIAVTAARALFRAGYRTPHRMRDATWQQRVDALGEGHYRRYDERTATQLGELAERVLAEHAGDLRRLRDRAARTDGAAGAIEAALQQFTGIGPAGAAIFCREVQGVWPVLAPYVDDLVADGAATLGLPTDAEPLAALVATDDLPRLAAACVRVHLHPDLADDVVHP